MSGYKPAQQLKASWLAAAVADVKRARRSFVQSTMSPGRVIERLGRHDNFLSEIPRIVRPHPRINSHRYGGWQKFCRRGEGRLKCCAGDERFFSRPMGVYFHKLMRALVVFAVVEILLRAGASHLTGWRQLWLGTATHWILLRGSKSRRHLGAWPTTVAARLSASIRDRDRLADRLVPRVVAPRRRLSHGAVMGLGW